MNTIGFIGAGNMGSAILRGIAGSDMKPEAELFAYNPTEAKVDALADCGVQKCKSAAEVVEKSRYVFLAIKPQKFEEVLPQIADAVTEQTVLVSIAAGIGAEFIRKLTKPFAKVVLAMPNTPLLLGEGATALAKDDSVSDAEFAVVRNIFGSCGMTAGIAPEQMKEAVAYIDGRAETECSGNVTLENIQRMTDVGVDYISSGALTHSAPILDISLKNLHRI